MNEVIIRHGESADIPAIRAIFQEEITYSATLQLPYSSYEKWQNRLTNLPAGHYDLVAELDGQVIGQLGFQQQSNPRRRHVGSFGMGVLSRFQGQGVGSRLVEAALDLADNWLNLKRIELEVYTDNDAAIALYEKYGFIIEGEAHAYAFRNGLFADVYFMARVKTST